MTFLIMIGIRCEGDDLEVSSWKSFTKDHWKRIVALKGRVESRGSWGYK